MQPVDASLIPRPYLVEPEQDFDNGDFSSSHYNKIAADPRTYRRSISNPSAKKDKTNDDGTTTGSGNGSGSYSDNGDDSDDYSTIKDRFSAIPRAIPANGATQHRESFLSMSLKKSNSKLGLESPQRIKMERILKVVTKVSKKLFLIQNLTRKTIKMVTKVLS